jgi:LPXTG-site transpeptidase (sortase) family protein
MTHPRTPQYQHRQPRAIDDRRSLVVPRRGEALHVEQVQTTKRHTAWVSNDTEIDAIINSIEKEEKATYQVKPKTTHVIKHPQIARRKKTETVTQPKIDAQSPIRMHRQLAQTAKKTDILQKSLHVEQTHLKKKRTGFSLFSRKAGLVMMATVIVALSGYVSIDTWLTNRKVESQYVHASSVSSSSDNRATEDSGEGRDESNLPQGALANYKVSAEQPRAVYIPKLKVSARLMPMGVNKDSSLQAPKNIFDAGWYTQSAIPSKGGAVVVDAHASGPTREGLFAYLDTLAVGDMVTIETGNGTKYTYKVTLTETVDRTQVDMQKLMLPSGNAIQGANFITCSGKWQEKESTFSQRTIVYTELVK